MPQQAAMAQNQSFKDRVSGPFDGLVRIDDARQLAVEIETIGPWYLFEPTLGGQATLVDGTRARGHLEGLLEEILREEKGVWTTMVYVQSRHNPELIKVFHPRRAGCGCGGGDVIVPWWIMSRDVPESIPGWTQSACSIDSGGKKSWLGKFFP